MAKAQNQMTNITLLVDTSGSMAHLAGKLNEQVKMYVGEFGRKKNSNVSIVYFADHVGVVNEDVSVNDLTMIRCSGLTALYSVIGRTLDRIKSKYTLTPHNGAKRGIKKDKELVVVLTDGENTVRSMDYNPTNLGLLMKEITKKHKNVTVACNVPDANGRDVMISLGISAGNITIWEQTEKGLEQTLNDTYKGTQSLIKSKSRGTTEFYNAPKAAKVNKMKKVTAGYRLLKTTKDSVISDFVKEKTKKEYVTGSAFYQLVKTEKVQSYKNVLLRRKVDGEVFSGTRQELGLDSNADTKIKPGDLGGFDVFVQSTSVNRKLPRGSMVLINKSEVSTAAKVSH